MPSSHNMTIVGPDFTGKITATTRTSELTSAIIRLLIKRLYFVGELLKTLVQENISSPSRAAGRSKAGQFPGADTGRLRNSIFFDVDELSLSVIIGTNLFYGLILERGHKGGVAIIPTRRQFLSFMGRGGKRVFVRRVIQGPIQGRSFLKRTMIENRLAVEGVFRAPATGLNF